MIYLNFWFGNPTMEMNFSTNVVVSKVVLTEEGDFFNKTEYLITLKNVLTYKTYKFKYFSGEGNRTWKNDRYYSGFWSKYFKRGQRVDYSRFPNFKKVEECPVGNQKYQQEVFDKFISITDPPKFDLSTFRQCIFSDARCGMLSFHEFCSEFGYNPDSRKAYKIHKACAKTYEQLFDLGISVKTIEEFSDN